MDMTVMQYDIVYNAFSFAIAVMGAATVFLFLGRSQVAHHYKTAVTISGLVLVTGKDFYSTFAKFGGLVINNKYQLPLPRDFFDRNTEGIFD